MFMDMDCEEKMLSFLLYREYVCFGEDYLVNVVFVIF